MKRPRGDKGSAAMSPAVRPHCGPSLVVSSSWHATIRGAPVGGPWEARIAMPAGAGKGRMQPRDTSCLFCAIAAGHVPCHAVYEDEHLLAFSGPSALESGVRPGRAQTPRAGLSPLGLRAVWRAHAARPSSGAMPGTLYQPPKVGLFGIGFHVPHVHVHVVPLYAMADMTAEAFERAQRTSPAVAVLVDSAAQIRHALAVMEDDDTGVRLACMTWTRSSERLLRG